MIAEPVHFRLGNFRCIALADRHKVLAESDITRIFPTASEAMLSAFRSLTAPLNMGSNLLLVETGEKRILIDSGNGPNPADPGHLFEHLRTENIAPESVDMVVITHYHGDHIAGLLDGEGNSAFANAQLIVLQPEHAYWSDEAVLASLDANRAEMLRHTFAAYASRLTVMDDTTEIVPGIRYVSAFGHTAGHCAVSIESDGQQLLHVADTMHIPLQLNAADMCPKFDHQPDLAVATRRTLIDRAEAEKRLLMVFHFPFPGLGYIQRTGNGLAWLPFAENA